MKTPLIYRSLNNKQWVVVHCDFSESFHKDWRKALNYALTEYRAYCFRAKKAFNRT